MHNFYISHTAFNVFYFINKKIILRARKLTSKTRNVGFQRLLYKKEIFFEKRYRFFFSGGCSLWHPGYRSKRFFGRCLQVLVGRETNKGFSLSHNCFLFLNLRDFFSHICAPSTVACWSGDQQGLLTFTQHAFFSSTYEIFSYTFVHRLQVLVGRETNKGFSLSHTQHAFVGLPTNESTNPQYVSKNQRHQRPSDKMLLKNNDIAQVKNITPP